MSCKIIIADDHEVIYQGLRMLISQKMPDTEIEWAVDLAKLREVIDTDPYDLIILDINLPSGNARSFVENHSANKSTPPILIFSAYEEQLFAAVFIRAGAQGYVQKGESSDTIFEAITCVLNGKRYLSKNVNEILVELNTKGAAYEPEQTHFQNGLTPRELDVARLVASGHNTQEITVMLNVSRTAVGTYKKRIFKKLRVDNAVDLSRLFEKGNYGQDMQI